MRKVVKGAGRAIEVLDTTLRDGAQAEGVSFSISDKKAIAETLLELGIAYVEAGNPGSNPKDADLVAKFPKTGRLAKGLVAFGSTFRPGSSPARDRRIQMLAKSPVRTVSIFGKAWLLHVREILHTTEEENRRMVSQTVGYLVKCGKRVIFDAEHFFSGYRDSPRFALDTITAAADAGADTVVLCETNGGAFPDEVAAATAAAVAAVGGKCRIGIHAHDDSGLAVANTIAAVKAGATHIQGTLTGFGERCGNANLATLIGNLQLKLGYKCIPVDKLSMLTSAARRVAEISNMALPGGSPYVGRRAFAHKGGMHVDGVRKVAESFEHVPPAAVGNSRRFLVSEVAGKSAIVDRIRLIFPEIEKNDRRVDIVLSRLKELERDGFQFEGADGSFENLIRKSIMPYKPFFSLERYRVMGERIGETSYATKTSAMVKVSVGDETELTAAEGFGPVNALDSALRKALARFYPSISSMKLTDYKVRVLEGSEATASKVRVLIESTDGRRIWNTVGVSYDIIEASWMALVDSVENKLLHDNDK